jgi:hypothetical protein
VKRSRINRLQKSATDFFRGQGFRLPAWAWWRPADWKKAGEAARPIKERMLGWDISDFGKNDFDRLGVLIFTLRNGPRDHSGEPYCEKALVLKAGQELPVHYHWVKTEDIINRGGGELIIRVWPEDSAGGLGSGSVKVLLDGGLWREAKAGEELRILPGGSITLVPKVYHSFAARGGDVLIGEVSAVNDDTTDNCFLEPLPRFAAPEEDEEILYYLCQEYPL